MSPKKKPISFLLVRLCVAMRIHNMIHWHIRHLHMPCKQVHTQVHSKAHNTQGGTHSRGTSKQAAQQRHMQHTQHRKHTARQQAHTCSTGNTGTRHNRSTARNTGKQRAAEGQQQQGSKVHTDTGYTNSTAKHQAHGQHKHSRHKHSRHRGKGNNSSKYTQTHTHKADTQHRQGSKTILTEKMPI